MLNNDWLHAGLRTGTSYVYWCRSEAMSSWSTE